MILNLGRNLTLCEWHEPRVRSAILDDTVFDGDRARLGHLARKNEHFHWSTLGVNGNHVAAAHFKRMMPSQDPFPTVMAFDFLCDNIHWDVCAVQHVSTRQATVKAWNGGEAMQVRVVCNGRTFKPNLVSFRAAGVALQTREEIMNQHFARLYGGD
jgi:hypothetical protein